MLVIIVFSSVSIWQLFSKFSAYWNYLLYAAIVYMIGAWIRLYADRIRMSHKYLKITGVIVISALLLFLFSVEIVSNGAIAEITRKDGWPQTDARVFIDCPGNVRSVLAAWKSDFFCGVLVCGEFVHPIGGGPGNDSDSCGCHSSAVYRSDVAVRNHQCCFGDSDYKVDYAFFDCTSCVSCH